MKRHGPKVPLSGALSSHVAGSSVIARQTGRPRWPSKRATSCPTALHDFGPRARADHTARCFRASAGAAGRARRSPDLSAQHLPASRKGLRPARQGRRRHRCISVTTSFVDEAGAPIGVARTSSCWPTQRLLHPRHRAGVRRQQVRMGSRSQRYSMIATTASRERTSKRAANSLTSRLHMPRYGPRWLEAPQDATPPRHPALGIARWCPNVLIGCSSRTCAAPRRALMGVHKGWACHSAAAGPRVRWRSQEPPPRPAAVADRGVGLATCSALYVLLSPSADRLGDRLVGREARPIDMFGSSRSRR